MNLADSPVATTCLIVISLACHVSIQGGRALSRRMTVTPGETKPLRQRAMWFRKPHRMEERKRGLCYNSCGRDLTSFFVTGLCGQPGGSVPSPNGFKSTLSRRAASGSWEVWRSVGWVHPLARKHCLRRWFKSAHRDRPSVYQCSVCLILAIHPPHYRLVSASSSPLQPPRPPSLNFLMSSISAISLDLKESSMSSITELFAV